ncbi:transaldolase [Campylobacter sp. MIT 99-7217]|uniref:transaldolase n=1 Tax=Campylobacter sp. MIT 99-7217 TaxID=535091 RepID=UPI001157155A|nr:transaldolase [Campylobacter sp. MIT 99-7217]TQR32321.1 transaldolase [Campylobacter sp. MIT 99-7217]
MSKFSLWCDFIENSFLDNEFLELITQGFINGATSNPAIFKNAILNSPIYKAKIANLKGKKAKEIYEILATEDIAKAADKLALNFYTKNDGFISLEIDPRLWDNASLSTGEAKRLYNTIGKANVMMKIPATQASYEAMYELMKSGISVNATLIFSYDQAKRCFEALNEGLKAFRENNFALKGNKRTPKAVISVFVSRFDRLLNSRVKDKNSLGILTASLAYDFIHSQNEPNIRTLFASTGVKGDDLPKDFYIKELLFEDSVNTAPLDALHAFKGQELKFKKALSFNELHQKLLEQDISQDELEKACKFLLDDGLKQFCTAFEEILQAL